MGFLSLISNAFAAIGQVFGFARQRDEEKNSPAVQAAAAAQKEQNAEDQTRAALAKADLNEIRKELSE